MTKNCKSFKLIYFGYIDRHLLVGRTCTQCWAGSIPSCSTSCRASTTSRSTSTSMGRRRARLGTKRWWTPPTGIATLRQKSSTSTALFPDCVIAYYSTYFIHMPLKKITSFNGLYLTQFAQYGNEEDEDRNYILNKKYVYLQWDVGVGSIQCSHP